jgi:hypothetical protein
MAETVISPPSLNREEWSLIAHLLELKQRDLLAEIRHTDTRSFREVLQERLRMVEDLLRKIPAGEE